MEIYSGFANSEALKAELKSSVKLAEAKLQYLDDEEDNLLKDFIEIDAFC